MNAKASENYVQGANTRVTLPVYLNGGRDKLLLHLQYH
jgi:hypothetical protein